MFEIEYSKGSELMEKKTQDNFDKIEGIEEIHNIFMKLYDAVYIGFGDDQICGLCLAPDHKTLTVYIKRLCKLMFEDKEETSKNEVVNITFEMIRETVEKSKSKEKEGKTSYYLNKIMHHFNFRKSFYMLVNSFRKDEDAGNFIRIICDYMFRNVEPDIENGSKYISYFNMFKKGLDISKHRAEARSVKVQLFVRTSKTTKFSGLLQFCKICKNPPY